MLICYMIVFIKWGGLVLKKLEFVLEWVATALLIAGVALTAWNVYPENIYLSLAGNFEIGRAHV